MRNVKPMLSEICIQAWKLPNCVNSHRLIEMSELSKFANKRGYLHNFVNPKRFVQMSERCYQKFANSRESLPHSVKPNRLVERSERCYDKFTNSRGNRCNFVWSYPFVDMSTDALRNFGKAGGVVIFRGVLP